MTITRTTIKGTTQARVIVDFNDDKARRVFVKFADTDAKKRAEKVAVAARIEAPRGETGHLAENINVSRSRDVLGRWSTGWDVTADTDYAIYVHEGTRPHKIVGNPLLGFFWPKVGRFVVFASVHHPGTRANNFLGRALRAAR